MLVSELIAKLQKMPQDATVIISSGDYPCAASSVSKINEDGFDGYYTPGVAAKRRDCIVVIFGGI